MYEGVMPVQDIVLALLSKEPSHGYELHARMRDALGSLGGDLSAAQIYVTLGRLERAGLVVAHRVGQAERPDRKVYELTPEGQERVAHWLGVVAWPRPAPSEFHLKLVAAAAGRLADPVELIDAQRRELLRQLSDAERAALAQPADSAAAVVLEGTVLRLQADVRWLETCEGYWARRRLT
jgi:DNA-binding PadR family transcriptional regulator